MPRKRHITLFPVKKKRRHVSRACRAETLSVYCYCRMPDHGQLMVHCSQCGDWFHHQCLQKIPDDDVDFICSIFSKKLHLAIIIISIVLCPPPQGRLGGPLPLSSPWSSLAQHASSGFPQRSSSLLLSFASDILHQGRGTAPPCIQILCIHVY